MEAQKPDEQFDRGESIVPYLDVARAVRPGLAPERVNGDFHE